MNIIHKLLARAGVGQIVPDLHLKENYCCLPVELPIDPRLPVITSVKEAKKEMKRLAIKHLFRLGDHIPPEERFTITMSGEDADRYQCWVKTLCLEKINGWRDAKLPY